jgi:hypothetical protein
VFLLFRPNPAQVSWDIISCAPLTQGTIKLLLKQGGSAFYQALNLSNAAQPIVAVKVGRHPTGCCSMQK